ncbi:MAG: pantoate--beta-alanine ligase [Bacteroidetes bacterium]|nr:pantoate--beta-alanine ligase [Bacteroidota bacterium]
MKIFNKIRPTRVYLESVSESGKTIGFVPTMGALHEGHLSLLKRSKQDNDITTCSIFVNPIQFNNPEDLEKYPHTLKSDIKVLESLGCDMVFVPSVEEIYPEPETTVYDFGHLDKVMEGKYRHGHFNGVAIVVRRFFEIIRPNRAYFGEKDFQQLIIIQKMVEMLNLDVEVIPCPILRESDGLAMSSRNTRLTSRQRKVAPVIHKTLLNIKTKVRTKPFDEIKKWVKQNINKQPEMKLEYIEIVDKQTLLPISSLDENKRCIACIAVYLGEVRLIDNIKL